MTTRDTVQKGNFQNKKNYLGGALFEARMDAPAKHNTN